MIALNSTEQNTAHPMSPDSRTPQFVYSYPNTPITDGLGLDMSNDEWTHLENSPAFSYLESPHSQSLNVSPEVAGRLHLGNGLSLDELAYLQLVAQHQHHQHQLQLGGECGGHSHDHKSHEGCSDSEAFTPSPNLAIEGLDNEMMLFSGHTSFDITAYQANLMRQLHPIQAEQFIKSVSKSTNNRVEYLEGQNEQSESFKQIQAIKQSQKINQAMLTNMDYESLISRTNEWKAINSLHGSQLAHNQSNLMLEGIMPNAYPGLMSSPNPANLNDPSSMMLQGLPYPYYPHPMAMYQNAMPNFQSMFQGFEDNFMTNNPHHNSFDPIKVKRHKNVGKACTHCKKAHLACDESRPCKRCTHLGKQNCIDVEHKRRGRPKSSATNSSSAANTNPSGQGHKKQSSLSKLPEAEDILAPHLRSDITQ